VPQAVASERLSGTPQRKDTGPHCMSQAPKHPPPDAASPRRRRAPGQIHRLLLQAAREVFEEKGYARATTKEITLRAGVAETLLFRNFGSKANLFTEAVLLPLADFFSDWVRRFTNAPPTPDVLDTQYRFNESLYEMAAANRGLLLTFFATAVFEPELLAAHDAIAAISESLDALGEASEAEVRRLGVDLEGYDVLIGSRMVVGQILALALFDSILLPTGDLARSREDLLQQLTRQVLFGGLNARPALRELNGETPQLGRHGYATPTSAARSSGKPTPRERAGKDGRTKTRRAQPRAENRRQGGAN
jgi:AcrR family transcriptional regulator